MAHTAVKKSSAVFDMGLLKRIFVYASPHKKKFYLSLALALLLAVIAPLRPLLINHTLKSLDGRGGFQQLRLTDFLLFITLIQVGLIIVETLFRFSFSYLSAWLGHKVVKQIRVHLFQKIVSFNLRQFDKTPIGTLTTRTINDIESINDIFSEGVVPILADLLSILAILSAMFYTDWLLTLVCIIPFPLLIVATYFFKESVNRSFTSVRNAIAALNAFVQEHITGMQVIQAFTAEEREYNRFKNINSKHRDANIQAIFAYSVFFPIVEIVLAFSMGLLVWFAAKQAIGMDGQQAVVISGKIISFTLLLNLLFRPLRVIADKFNVLQMGMVAGERVMAVLDNPDTLDEIEGAYGAKVKGKIEFKDVSFSYINNQTVLDRVSFDVERGGTVAIVGHTGSGKSTIISLINRMYQHQSGQILVDDIPVQQWSIGALRKGIAVVLQDVFLFSGSVMDNITLRDPAIKKEDVIRAAKLIGIHDFIEQLPGGYDYDVMERGGTLSLGQRQLISFIRALLFNPAILILDEATSSVDTHTEKLIQHAIEVLTNGRTSILIAHRLSTVRKANRILVLDKGVVVESGTHEELVKRGGYYAKLIDFQSQSIEA